MSLSSGISFRSRSRNRMWSRDSCSMRSSMYGLTSNDVCHVAAFVFDRDHAIEVALKRLNRELQARQLSRHAD